jgi:hypothetical protein
MITKEIYTLSSSTNLGVIKELVSKTEKGKYKIDNVVVDTYHKNKYFEGGSYDSNERVMTIYYRVKEDTK